MKHSSAESKSHLPGNSGNGELVEFTLRSVVIGIGVAILISASYPYVVLKLGFGPNISVVSAFFGYIALAIIVPFLKGPIATPQENNLIQTAGTSAGQTAFMCVLLAAFDMINTKSAELGIEKIIITPWESAFWLCAACTLGVLLAVPMRRHYIDEENLSYADGTAAAEAIVVLYADKKAAAGKSKALGIGLFLSAITTWFRDGKPMWIAATSFWGAHGETMKIGMDWSLLSFGSGLIVGMRICISMLLGMILSWNIIPPYLHQYGIIQDYTFKSTLTWVMWPATGMMIAGGLTSLFLKWKLIMKTFTSLRTAKVSTTDFPIKWVWMGSLVLIVLLAFIQYRNLHIPIYITLISIIFSVPLMLVGLRVLGETNWGPVSALSNMMQAIFALISPGHIPINMIGSGMTGSIATQSEALMQDYKAGKIIGNNNRYLTYMQLITVPVGAIIVSFVYGVLKNKYGVGEAGLSSPISVKWAGFAELLAKGFSALPKGCFVALLVAIIFGAIMTVLEQKYAKYIPSPTGFGIGMLIPFSAMFPMVLGGICQYFWNKVDAKSEENYNTPLASGFIAGEALMAVIIPILMIIGIL
jgi:putative OPT family oligopeptide transporter